MKRGEVWWADLPKPIGRRPVVLLSRDEAYNVRNAVTVAPVTTHIRHISVEVFLSKEDGLPKDCVINLDSIITIRKELLSDRITVLGEGKVGAMDAAIKFALGLK